MTSLHTTTYSKPGQQMEHSVDSSKVPDGKTIRPHIIDNEGVRHEPPHTVYDRWTSLGWKVVSDSESNTPSTTHVVIDPFCSKRWDWSYPITVNFELVDSYGTAQHANA